MNDSRGYAVFFYPQALEALGDAIKPYLQDGPAGLHVSCNEVDTGGALIEMTLRGHLSDGRDATLELMVPSGMVRMIVSTQSDGAFGFTARAVDKPGPVVAGDVAEKTANAEADADAVSKPDAGTPAS
jgi:hypothetical protein